MLAKARAKESANPGRAGASAPLQFLRGDAEALPFADGAFDCIVSLFALRHFPHPAAALAQMWRVLTPGGRVVVAVGSGPRLNSAAGLRAAGRRLREAVGLSASRHDLIACRCLDELVQQHLPPLPGGEEAGWTHRHTAGGALPAMMRRAGFTHLRVHWSGSEGVVDSIDEFWELQATFSSLARKRLESAPAEAVARLRQAFESTCASACAAGGRLRYPTGALIVAGAKPS
jgi:SAM-dependent methyltransferase